MRAESLNSFCLTESAFSFLHLHGGVCQTAKGRVAREAAKEGIETQAAVSSH